MALPHGKYKGKELFEIPDSYLRWLAENYNDEKICEAADRELRWRDKNNQHIKED